MGSPLPPPLFEWSRLRGRPRSLSHPQALCVARMPIFAQRRGEEEACLSATASPVSSPRLLGDSASSIDTDRTFVVANRSLTRPPSPAPLLYVTLTLPPSMMMTRPPQRLQRLDVDGLVRSPAARRGPCAAVDSASEVCTPLFSARLGAAAAAAAEDVVRDSCAATPSLRVSYSAVDLVDAEAEDGDEADPLRAAASCVSFTRSCEASTTSTASTATRVRAAADWATLWTQLFPLHIAGFLCLRDVMEVGQVCRLAHEATREPWVWRTLAVHHHGIQPTAVERTFATAARLWLQEEAASLADAVAAAGAPVPAEPEEPLSPLPVPARPRRCTPAPVLATSPHHRNSQRRPIGVPPVVGLEQASADASTPGARDNAEAAAARQTPSPRFPMPTAPVSAAQSTDAPLSPGAAASPAVATACPVSGSSPSRYLWQTAAAAMPSPSSPAAHQDDDDDGADSDAGNVAREEPTHPVVAPLSLTTTTTAAAATAGRLLDQPTRCASPRSGTATPLTEDPVHGSPAASVATTAPDKWRALRWAMAQEPLPPPTPGQLESSAVSGESAAVEGDPVLWASFSASSLRPHPVTDGMGDAASSPVSPGALSAGPPPAAASAPPLPVPPALAAYSYTLCRVTAEWTLLRATPEFPWRAFTQYLHMNRVQRSLGQLAALSSQARAELCRGGAWDTAYGALSHAVHVLLQRGGCRSVEHLTHLAETLVRRASLCRHRGHYFALAAFTDLSLAAMLCPDSTCLADLAELRARPELAQETPASWLQRCGEAAAVASPVALLGIAAQVPALFAHNRALCFCSALASYMQVRQRLGHSLSHLLCRAVECAAPGSEEALLVSALREVAAVQQAGETAAGARRACATADYALSLLPLPVRDASEALCAAWVRDCLPAGRLVSPDAVARWADTAPEARAYHQGTPLEVRWLAWLAHEVRWFAHEELACPAPAQAPLLSLVFAATSHTRAEALVRLATQYADPETRGEDLQPALPYGTGRDTVAKMLLAGALRVRPLHTSAALLLSRLHGRDAETADQASAVLTDCIHAWAQRCSLLEMRAPAEAKRSSITSTSAAAATRTPLQPPQRPPATPPSAAYLHRRDRKPELCFVPSELLVERSRCVHTIADLAEATEQHPGLSYPYQMRAAMAMDRGYHLAAVMELSRIMTLTMDVNDVALRVRFLHDATDMAAAAAANTAAAVAAGAASASAGSLTAAAPALAAANASLASMPTDAELVTELSTSRVGPPAAAAAGTAPVGAMGEVVAAADAAFLTSPQLAPLYQAWLSRMSGLLSLLSPPPPQPSRAASIPPPRSRLASREGPLMPGGGAGAGQSLPDGHVSRVASLAFSDAEEEDTRGGAFGAGGFDAAHIRAFLDDLLAPTASNSMTATARGAPG